MRFIQNHELREWVKESLRKAIFQKAHALAIQTGCEILIKLQDDSTTDNTTDHQYYATKVLRQAYHNNRLRMHPDDKLVSGETGMPVVSQGLQIGDGLGDGMEGLMVANQMGEDDYEEHYLANGDVMTQTPMQMHMGEVKRHRSEVADHVQSEICPSASTLNDTIPEVRIKVEEMDNDEEESLQCVASVHDNPSERLSESSVSASSLQVSASSLPRSTIPINPKPYQCAVCHKAFRSIQVLQKHTQTFHVRPHGVGMLRSRGREGHLPNRLPLREQFHDLAMPPGLPPDFKGFYCMMCNQDFPNSSALQDHMALSHMDSHHTSESSSSQSSSTEKKPSIGAPSSISNKSLFISPPDPGPAPPSSSSSVPIFLNLPSSPGAPFSQGSPSGPMFSHPGLPVGFSRASSSSGRRTGNKLLKHRFRKKISSQSAMTAILLTAGPIVTHRAVSSYGPGYVRSAGFYIAKAQFVDAAAKLQSANLGTLINFTSATFVKKHPDEIVGEIQNENETLCAKDMYRNKFEKPIAKCITQNSNLMKQIFAAGLLRAEQSKHRTYTKRLMGKQLCDRDIMSAILQTAGPVATHFTVLTASPNFILGSTYITKEQFVAAASALQDMHLGSLVTVRHVHGRPSVNFVKKRPEEVKEILEQETDLCSPSLYEEKYKTATPACVPQGTRDKLVSLGLVSRDDFK